jgi:uncharacterized protein (DUF697 family)
VKKNTALLEKLDQSLQRKTPARSEPAAPAPRSEQSALRPQAEALVHRTMLLVLGVGLIPLAPLNTIAVAALQLKLVRDLSLLYQVKFSEHRIKALLAALTGSAMPAAVSRGSIGGALRAVHGIGPALGLAAFPLTAAATTLAVGKVFTSHFESRGNLLSFDAAGCKAQFRQEFAAAGSFLKREAGALIAELRP